MKRKTIFHIENFTFKQTDKLYEVKEKKMYISVALNTLYTLQFFIFVRKMIINLSIHKIQHTKMS